MSATRTLHSAPRTDAGCPQSSCTHRCTLQDYNCSQMNRIHSPHGGTRWWGRWRGKSSRAFLFPLSVSRLLCPHKIRPARALGGDSEVERERERESAREREGVRKRENEREREKKRERQRKFTAQCCVVSYQITYYCVSPSCREVVLYLEMSPFAHSTPEP
jgi:hypothetical protein